MSPVGDPPGTDRKTAAQPPRRRAQGTGVWEPRRGARLSLREERRLTSEASCARRLRPQSSGQEDKVSLKRQTNGT